MDLQFENKKKNSKKLLKCKKRKLENYLVFAVMLPDKWKGKNNEKN